MWAPAFVPLSGTTAGKHSYVRNSHEFSPFGYRYSRAMIKLNLLPLQEKEALALEKTQRWIIFYGSAITGIFLIFVALLIIIWAFIAIQLKSAVNNLESVQSSFKGQDLKTQQAAVADLNKYLEKIASIQKNQKSYSVLLISLSNLVPSGIRLNTLAIDRSDEISLNGYAQRRELILAFKDSLEKSNLFTDIENPLSNLIKQTDINFYFKFKLLPNAPKK